jgi:hypothetical protein
MKPITRAGINPRRMYPHHGHPSLSYPLKYANTPPIATEGSDIQMSCARVISEAAFLI